MKKRFILGFIFLLTLPSIIYAHTLLLNVFDNEDNTITVEGVFNTGQLANGAQIRLESLLSGKVLYKKRLPDESELTIAIPNEAYQIVLDGGPGHQIIQNGPAPKNGFIKEVKADKKVELSQPRQGNKQWGTALIVTIALAFALLFLTIFISFKNTNKLMLELQKDFK